MNTSSVIYKYQITETSVGHTTLMMRTSSKIIMVAAMLDEFYPAIWVEHLTSELGEKEDPYTVVVHSTGHQVPADGRIWIGSAVCGSYVWHVYGWWGGGVTPPGFNADAPMKQAGTDHRHVG